MNKVWNPLLNEFVAVALDAEWREEDHPRQDDGKFGFGSGSGTVGGQEEKAYQAKWSRPVKARAEVAEVTTPNLSPEQKKAVENYAGSMYVEINEYLKSAAYGEGIDNLQEVKDTIKNLDSAMAAAKPLKSELLCERGANADVFFGS